MLANNFCIANEKSGQKIEKPGAGGSIKGMCRNEMKLHLRQFANESELYAKFTTDRLMFLSRTLKIDSASSATLSRAPELGQQHH